MSEYQYYEFLAIDRPLDDSQLAEVRSHATGGVVTPTSLVSEHDGDDFPGDPNRLMERYYDTHVYLADWGTRRVMFRLPLGLLDINTVEDYFVDDLVSAWTTDESLVLDLISEDEDEPKCAANLPEETLSAIIGARTELATGDLRPLYLAWLASYGTWERDEDAFDREADGEVEPPVPAGLARLTPAQRALADFLRLDADLLAVAAHASAPLPAVDEDPAALQAWVTGLPSADKDRLLGRVIRGEAAAVRLELLRRFRGQRFPGEQDTISLDGHAPAAGRRTVADLLDAAARLRADRDRPAD